MSNGDRDPRGDLDELLGELPVEVPPPPELRAAVVRRLRAAGEIEPTGAARRWRSWVLTAAAAVVAFMAGRMSAPAPVPLEPSGQEVRTWVLLLYEDAHYQAGGRSPGEVVELYAAWAREERTRGRLVLAEKLGDVETVLSAGEAAARPADETDGRGVLTGMFVVRAPTRGEAIAMARSSPHYRLGGVVVLREID